MNTLSILYVGRNCGTSRHRASALRRLGHEVFIINPATLLPKAPFANSWTWQTGGFFFEGYIRRQLLANLPNTQFDLVFVDCGELVGPALVSELKNRFGTIVNYNIDDPYGGRDGLRWRLYLAAARLYDLIVVVRDCNIPEAFAAGARRVLRVHMSADEVAHAPRPLNDEDFRKWSSDVSFIGTWMPERGPFMARLIALGVPLSIYGNRWHKAREWPVLCPFWRGPGLSDDSYARSIQCAKVSLGLLSKGNRDLSTTRSFEIPSLGGVLCAERTTEHARLYAEDQEAVFWSSPEECAAKCMQLIGDEERRKNIAISGRQRHLRNETTNEHVLSRIVGALNGSATAEQLTMRNIQRSNALASAVAAPSSLSACSAHSNFLLHGVPFTHRSS
jgi:spore maturation protein CgeB